MNAQKLEENIYYYTELFDNLEEYMLTLSNESIEWKDWFSSDNEILYGSYIGGQNPLPDSLLEPIKSLLFRCLEHYTENTGLTFGWVPDFYRIQKYSLNAYMGPHVDSIDKTQSKYPTISIVLYLNDNYEGGNICFPEQNLDIKPEAGSMIIFPSYPPYYHDPKPVTKGTKYMCPIFCFKEAF